MQGADFTVVHLVTRQTPSARLAMLETMLRCRDLATGQLVLHLGPGAARLPRWTRVGRVHSALPHPRIGGLALKAALNRRGLLNAGAPLVLHAWSHMAASWCLSLATTMRPLVLDVLPGEEWRDLARWCASTCLSLVCSTESSRRRLLAHGVPEPRCALIPPAAGQPGPDRERRREARSRLQLAEHDTAVLALPPVSRHAGTLTAVWGGLVLQKVRHDIRLLIPRDDRDLEHIRWFVRNCRHDHVVRLAPPEMTLGELLAASDLAIYLPRGEAPTDGLAAAIAAGIPLVASTAETADGLLVDGKTAWLARPDNPEDAARKLLRALEQPEQSLHHAKRAQAETGDRFAEPTVLGLYRQAYSSLVSRRPINRWQFA